MIDKLRARSPDAAIHNLIPLQQKEIFSLRRASMLPVVVSYAPIRLAQGDSFPAVFNHLSVLRDRLPRENTVTIHPGSSQAQRE